MENSSLPSSSNPPPSGEEDRYSHIRTCIAKFSTNFVPHTPGSYVVHGKNVALTGATGNVGASMLDLLMRRDDIKKIYLLNRRSKESVKASLIKTFKAKDLDASILDEAHPVLEYLVVDFSRKDLGLSGEDYNDLRNNVTHIIHSAWLVNFIVDLSKYEPTHIAGVRHLIDLALSSPQPQPPRFSFVSTIAASIRYQGSSQIPEIGEKNNTIIMPEIPVDDPSIAMPVGYGESKYISERILVNAAMEAGLRTTVIRVGQLSGMSTNGEWAKSEIGMIIIQTWMAIGIYADGVPSFRLTPSDVAASAILKQSFVDSEPLQYFSVDNPFPTHMDEITAAISVISPNLSFPVRKMHWTKWLEYLEEGDFDPRLVPGVLLVSVFRDGMTNATRNASMGWNKSVKVAPELANGPVGREMILKYIRYWMAMTGNKAKQAYRL
ncbi:hypothetical protein M422DRAFT_272859 [Sphaerobolus stellatus SS14]|uniref:Thioester reductase (TE) domain-containing protein n=1 Tax=Sphaerobolus stellatus (strain SS14) TaxID=990650 RepID=A0A0C9UAK6_SPHS4|nr:hypothetical protein M422DRAFT_272859 [Sphaerobolus stellatus SS14]